MIERALLLRAVALTMITMLALASTILPSVSYVQKYAGHLSQYGGYDARASAISGFASLYVDPRAPMLPIVLAAPGEVDMAAVLPSACVMDKTVLPHVATDIRQAGLAAAFPQTELPPAGVEPCALRGPPRATV